MKIKKLTLFISFIVLLVSCSKDESGTPATDLPTDINLEKGAGVFTYNYKSTEVNTSLNVYYYIPQNITTTTPLLFVFHGAQRNADEYRDAMISKANEFGFIVITPEFTKESFPGGDGYNLGNVFVDGDNPTVESLNHENEWAFSIIEPLFDHTKKLLKNENPTYSVFGHSGGGQFSHRFIMFKPNARINKMVTSASGWYTFPNVAVKFPYGFDESPLTDISLVNLFSKQIYVQVGDNDDDPNASSLRHNEFADAQGLHRKERAVNFFEYSKTLSEENQIPFNWNFDIVENADHDFVKASENAADLLFK
ncbi:hypothetical protein [Tenacibaculum sp. IB213877]|uniref:hypothetical protein n=1 Tax=Tenacibaculum sp. IB213877 TaxID=3097351 RepID=UPI002A5A5A3E|nr:hypothetical protein [Tenacibaculum sp. IB213877]MDY0781423.1 hypothetical protein [Tenacibaculum sp. IB213877]